MLLIIPGDWWVGVSLHVFDSISIAIAGTRNRRILPAESGAESALFGHAAEFSSERFRWSRIWDLAVIPKFDADIKQCRSYHVCITTHGIAQSVQYRPVA